MPFFIFICESGCSKNLQMGLLSSRSVVDVAKTPVSTFNCNLREKVNALLINNNENTITEDYLEFARLMIREIGKIQEYELKSIDFQDIDFVGAFERLLAKYNNEKQMTKYAKKTAKRYLVGLQDVTTCFIKRVEFEMSDISEDLISETENLRPIIETIWKIDHGPFLILIVNVCLLTYHRALDVVEFNKHLLKYHFTKVDRVSLFDYTEQVLYSIARYLAVRCLRYSDNSHGVANVIFCALNCEVRDISLKSK